MTELKSYPRGFIFSKKPLDNIPAHYKRQEIQGYHYYYDEIMDVNIVRDDTGYILIHGDFFHVSAKETLTKKELLNALLNLYKTNYVKYLNLLDNVTGRYTIIVCYEEEINIYTDPSNTRSTYFTLSDLVVSSHVNLINDNFRFKKSGISYALSNALYYTSYEEIRSTIANFSVNLNKNKYKRIFPRSRNRYTNLSSDEKYKLYNKISNQIFSYITSHYDEKLLSLSGGGDSRFSMALSKKYKDKIKYFTYVTNPHNDQSTPVKREAHKDLTIVKQMLDNLDFNHKFCYLNQIQNDYTAQEKKIIRKNTIAPHSMFLINLSRKFLPIEGKVVHIRSNLYEIGQAGAYKKTYRESNLEQFKIAFDKRYKKLLKPEDSIEEYDRAYYEFMNELGYTDFIYDYHLLDLYLWEIRLSRWHSEILNTHDVCFETLSPFNHRILLEIALSFNYEYRKNGQMFQELININWPVLNFFGDNNIKNMYESNKNFKS